MAWSLNPSTPVQKQTQIIGEGHASLHYTTVRLLNFKKKKFHDLESFGKMYSESTSLEGTNQEARKIHVHNAYSDLLKHHQKLTEEETLINRMERNAQFRNVIFRAVTTLTIGFSIMFVYFVAQKLGISMPLLRVPL